MTLQPKRQIVLDTETTGLKPEDGHRVIEIGAVELIDRVITGNNFHVYINPERHIDDEVVAVHGITQEFLKDKPIFADILKSFIAYIDGAEIIAHNAPFDTGFINYEFSLLSGFDKQLTDYSNIIDSLEIARDTHPGARNNLDALCKRYEVDLSKRTLHGALLDANLLAQVYLRMTGGQVSLFAEKDEKNDDGHMDDVQHQVENIIELPVIYATKAESEAHEKYMKRLTDSASS